MSIALDELRQVRVLAGLSVAELQRVASRLVVCDFLSGTVILTREAPAEALYLVLAGTVRVELRAPSGQVFNLVELGPGELFGERAILTGEARTAEVRAIGAVRAARLLRSDFEELLPETPRLSANLCRDLARQLGTWAQRHQREEAEHRAVLTDVIGWQLLPEFGAFPGGSSWVKALNARLTALGATEEHVLILGEPGTWKDLAARLIHFHGNTGRPVLFLDCAAPPPLPGEEGAGTGELAQSVALFGLLPSDTLAGRRPRRGMLELANGGDLILRNLDLLTPPVQARLADFLDSGRFQRQGEEVWRNAQVRIIATSGAPLAQAAARGVFNAGLFAALSPATVHLRPLRERKQDIAVISRSLLPALNAKHHKTVRRFSQEALNRLVDHDWPLNTSELYQVLSRAVIVCPGDELQAEQIFLQGEVFGGGRFNLLSLPAVEALARRPEIPRILRWSTIPLFLLVTGVILLGPARANVANLVVWTLWWPALLGTVLFVGRGWCSFCPLEGLGERLGAKARVGHEPPAWLRRFGPSLSLVALLAILLIEPATGMFALAPATGLLLAGLLVATSGADLLLGRRAWCKYLCPLGRIVSLLARVSFLEMRSNTNVCVSRCRVDDCIKEKGCPMGLHPTGSDNAEHCILCLDCVRNCPHHAMHLDLRNPAWGLFSRSRRSLAAACFSVSLVGVVLAVKAAPLLSGRSDEPFLQRLWSRTEVGVALLILLAAVGLVLLASSGPRRRWLATFTSCGLAYLPLAFTGLFLLYFRALIEGGAQIVPLFLTTLGLAGWFDLPRLTPELGTLRLLVPPLILAAAGASWFVLGRLQGEQNLTRYNIVAHRLLVLATVVVFLCLL